jgi:hypothetical protein
MKRAQLLALLFGVLLLSAPLIKAEEEEYDDDSEDEAEPEAGSPDEKDVVVVGKDNWEEKVKKSKFALVRGARSGTWGGLHALSARSARARATHPG